MVELETTAGGSVFVNPLHVVSISAAANHSGKSVSLVRLTGDETHHVFGATGEVASRLSGDKGVSSAPVRSSDP